MGSKGRIPPPLHLRRPPPGGGIGHPDSFGPGVRGPPPGPFPAFDMLPPPEVLEQKLAGQHVEIQKLATENQRLAATHVTLRQELAAAQQDLQMLHNDIGVFKAEREQQMRGLMEKISKMETELKAAEPIRLELQQARSEAETLFVARQELMAKVHQLTQDLHRAHVDVQQVPALISELDSLRQEYEQCRITFECEKKLFSDHRESLQAMENNYVTMSREVEKLRLELTNKANVDTRTVASGTYGGAAGNKDSMASAPLVGQNKYGDGYGIPQSQGYNGIPSNPAAGTAATNASTTASAGTPTVTAAQSGSGPPKSAYDAPRGPSYEATKVPGYDAPRGPGYDITANDSQRGHSHDAQRRPGHDMQKGPGYDMQRAPSYYAPERVPGYDVHRIPGYAPRGPGYDAQIGPLYDAAPVAGYDPVARGPVMPSHGQMAPANNMPYGSAPPPTYPGSGYDAQARGGNPVRR